MFKLSNIVRKSYFLNYSFNTASQIDVYRVNTLTFLTLQTDSNDSFLSKNNKIVMQAFFAVRRKLKCCLY